MILLVKMQNIPLIYLVTFLLVKMRIIPPRKPPLKWAYLIGLKAEYPVKTENIQKYRFKWRSTNLNGEVFYIVTHCDRLVNCVFLAYEADVCVAIVLVVE